MVLALSEDTINYQFAQLLAMSQIQAQWKLLVRRPPGGKPGGKPVVKTQADADFDPAMATWQKTQNHLAKLFAAGHYAEYGEQLGAATRAGLLWDYGWSATVSAPEVTVLAGDHLRLQLAIPFAGGSLAYNPDRTQGVLPCDLTGAVYAFNVPIGRLQIGSTDEILTPAARDQAVRVIRDSGLTDADFTIEALFLDFDNANISNFDETNSRFPADATTPLQIAIEDYFKLILPGQGNPYILGYGMQAAPAAVRPQPKALFQPTALRFSSSYSSTPGASALNYLLMLGGREFPPGQNVGILPASLLEGAGLDSSEDGVFAIDCTVFEQSLIDPFVAAIGRSLTGGFGAGGGYARTGQRWSLSASTSSTRDVSEPPSDGFQQTKMDTSRSMTSSIALTSAADGLSFAWSVGFAADVRVRPWELVHGGRITDYETWLSTGGQYQAGPTGKLGQPGALTMSIQPGASGSVRFQIGSVQKPELGYDQAPYIRKQADAGSIGAMIQSIYDQEGVQDLGQGALAAAGQIDGVLDSVKTSLQSAIDSLSVGKVILPLGQLYTFKAIRLLSADSTDDNAVAMNVAYAPVAGAAALPRARPAPGARVEPQETDARAGVQFSFYSELMQDWVPDRPFGAALGLRAVAAGGGAPMVFSVGGDDELHLLRPASAGATSWTLQDLSAGLGAVTAFDVRAGAAGTLRAAFAVQAGGRARLYASASVTPQAFDPELFDAGALWTEIPLPPQVAAARIDRVVVDEGGALLATSASGEDARYYTLDGTGRVTRYELPEDGVTVLQLSLGTFGGLRGVFLLYQLGPDRTMLFQSFPDPRFHKTTKLRFDPGGTISNFTLIGNAGASGQRLVTAGDGVFVFAAPGASAEVIVPAGGLAFSHVEAVEQAGAHSLWLVGADARQRSGLYFVTDRFYDSAADRFVTRWTSPLRMADSVAQFACLRGTEIVNHLFLISQSDGLVHFYQDAASTLWKRQPLTVPDAGPPRELSTYTLHLQFSDAFGDRLAGRTVTVWASGAIFVELNGARYQLGPSTAVDLTLDGDASLLITDPVDALHAPMIYVTGDFVGDTIAVDLAHKVAERLGAVRGADDLKRAVRSDGSPLLPADRRPADGTLDHVADGVQSLLGAAKHLDAAPPPPPGSGAARRAALRRAAAGTGAPGRRPPAVFAAIELQPGCRVVHRRGEAAVARLRSVLGLRAARVPAAAGGPALFAAGDFDELGHAFGDFLHWIEQAADEITGCFVSAADGLVQIAIQIGDAVYRFVATLKEQVMGVIELLFRELALAFSDLFAWLGFVFPWNDILDTQRALSGLIDSGLAGAGDYAVRLRGGFDRWIESVIARDLHSPELAQRLSALDGRTLADWNSQVPRPAPAADPRLRWAGGKVRHIAGVVSSGDPGGAGDLLARIAAALGELPGDFAVEYVKIRDSAEALIRGAIGLGEFAHVLLDSLAALALDTGKQLVDVVLAVVTELVHVVRAGLTTTLEIPIPLLTQLYALVTGGGALNLLDACCLLAAIPVTLIHKLATGRAPFAGGSDAFARSLKACLEALPVPGGAAATARVMQASAALMAAGEGGFPDRRVAFSVIAGCRMVRVFTFPMVSMAAIEPGVGVPAALVFDNLARTVPVAVLLIIGESNPKVLYNYLAFVLLLCLHLGTFLDGEPVTRPVPPGLQDKLGAQLNALGMIDAAVVTSVGTWAAVLTGEGWSRESDAARASDVTLEIFQIPAIVGFFANTIARVTRAPAATSAAATIATIRSLSMLASALAAAAES